MSGGDNKTDDGTEIESKEDPNPLEDLLVSEIDEATQREVAEAIKDLVGITREEHFITLKDGMVGLDLQRQVVAYMLARYARDILKRGHVTGSTSRASSGDIGAALAIHHADVDDAARGNGDLRWYQEGNLVELPHERVRHAARMLSRHRQEATDEDVEEAVRDVAGGDEGGG